MRQNVKRQESRDHPPCTPPHLQAYLQACAAVAEHVAEVRSQAVVRPRLNGQPDALGATLLAVADGLGNIGRGVACGRGMWDDVGGSSRVASDTTQEQAGSDRQQLLCSWSAAGPAAANWPRLPNTSPSPCLPPPPPSLAAAGTTPVCSQNPSLQAKPQKNHR